MDGLVEEVVPVVDVHKVVVVEVQAIDYQFVLQMANVVDEEDEDVDVDEDEDVLGNASGLVDNYYYYYCFPSVHYYHHNCLNDVVDNVYLNVV